MKESERYIIYVLLLFDLIGEICQALFGMFGATIITGSVSLLILILKMGVVWRGV